MQRPQIDSFKRPAFVSTQVVEAKRYYLHLEPKRNVPFLVVCGGYERMSEDYVVERKTFPYLCIEYVVDGSGSLELAGKRYPLRPGVAFAYAPGIPHSIRNDPHHSMRKYYVDFVGREARRLLAGSPLGRWMPVQISHPQELLEIFAGLQRDAFEEGPMRDELCSAHLRLLLLKIIQKSLPLRSARSRAFATYQRARHHMEKHFIKIQTAEDVARACHMTPVHLSRVFQRFAHTSPYHFLMRLKMNHATSLLLDSGLLVKEVAEDLGFPNPFQFSRAFKRVYGLAPEHFLHYQTRSAKR